MPFYTTEKNSQTYESTGTPEGEIIQEVDMEVYPFQYGLKYRVIGFLPPYHETEVNYAKSNGCHRFFIKGGRGGGMRIGLESLPSQLESQPKVGRRIVARLIGADGQLAGENCPGSVLVTEPLFCPHLPPLKKSKK